MNQSVPQPTPAAEYHDVDPAGFAEIVARGVPAVLRGAAADWPLVAQARRSPAALVDYLIGFDSGALATTVVAPPAAEGRLVYEEGRKALNHRHSPEKLPNVLKGLLRQIDAPEPIAISLQGLSARDQFPGLEAENGTVLVPAGTPPRLWIGNKVTVSPHFDAAENLAFVVAGRRRFTLFPPDQVANLYPGPFDLTPAGVPIAMPAHDAPDLARVPRFAEALAAAFVADLAPGDAVYVPYLWWHGVQSLDRFNMLVNYWWYSDPVAAEHPNGAVLRAAFELFRVMPDAHRRAWKPLFDFWVFGSEGDPMAHLPPDLRTAEPALDAEKIARFRDAVNALLK
ncbi:cupin-like domain-containing protein [Sphingomonas parva]|nr:cupin-like domain-containing protein [Sphingomonas parva]